MNSPKEKLEALIDSIYKKNEHTINYPNLGRVHNYWNHIPEDVQELWGVLSIETKCFLFIQADKEAANENWS